MVLATLDLESGEIELDGDGPSIELLEIGRDSTDDWHAGNEHFAVTEADCGPANP